MARPFLENTNHASPPLQDLMGVPIHPAEVAHLARWRPDLELKLHSVVATPAEPALPPPPPIAAVLADGWDVPEGEQ